MSTEKAVLREVLREVEAMVVYKEGKKTMRKLYVNGFRVMLLSEKLRIRLGLSPLECDVSIIKPGDIAS